MLSGELQVFLIDCLAFYKYPVLSSVENVKTPFFFMPFPLNISRGVQ